MIKPASMKGFGEARAPDIVRTLAHRAGLRLREQDFEAFARWIAQRMNARALHPIERYGELLAENSIAGRQERELLLVRFSTGESYFFRDLGQFDLLATTILPDLIERRAVERRLRIWSAGCATGEEAYSLAMLVDELASRLRGWEVLILGTDINTDALQRARRGDYGDWSFRTLDAERKQRYFRRHGEQWQIDARLRDMVTFRQSDLVRDRFPDAEAGLVDFDLILCRNATIYLNSAAVTSIIAKFAQTLSDGGFLITAHSELFGHDTGSLRVRTFAQSTVFQKAASLPVETPLTKILAQVRIPLVARLPRTSRYDPHTQTGTERERPVEPPRAAVEHCDRLIETAWHNADRGRSDQAEEACRKVIALAEFDPRPYYLLAQLAQERGETTAAKNLLTKAIYLDPSFIAAYLEIGALYTQSGEPDRARRMYETARAILQKIATKAVVAPYGDSTSADILKYVERLLGTAIGGGGTNLAVQEPMHRDA